MRRSVKRVIPGALLAVVLAGSALKASGQAPAATYEEERTRAVLAREGYEVNERAEGNRIALIRILRDDVFVEEEIIPTWLNVFHFVTRERVIERELLFHVGELYREDRIAESARNLRALQVFALVRIVPVRVPGSSDVGVVVHTRDLWSLRLENDVQVTGDQIDHLLLQLTERNLLGMNKTAASRFWLYPLTFTFGEYYLDRRMFGRRLRLFESLDVVFERDSGDPEGWLGSLVLSSPFYSLRERFAFSTSLEYESVVSRNIRDGVVVGYDDPATTDVESIPEVWDTRKLALAVMGYYRRGNAAKQTFGVGFRGDDLSLAPNAATSLPDEHAAAFVRDVLPSERRQIGPIVSYELFMPTYVVFESLATFGQSEDVRVGPRLTLAARMSRKQLGSSANSLVVDGTLGYVAAPAHALLDGEVGAGARLESGHVVDGSLRAQFRGATPPIAFGRVVWRFTWEASRNDTSNRLVTLGGDNGLRGYVSQAFFVAGGSLLRGNVELRTRPLAYGPWHLGAVAFYDVGTVYEHLGNLRLHHAIGLGLRLHASQVNRYPYRTDGGYALGGDGFVGSFGGMQAVPLTATEDEQLRQ